MSRKSSPPFHPDACPPSHALLQLTSPGSILKKTVVNANGYLVFEQGLSLYKDTYAFLCKIPQMLWGTRGIRANTLNYQILHERERYHRSLKRSSQSNCRLELRVIFFFCLFFFSISTLWCIGAIKVLHVSVKVSLPDRLRGEWQACSMCSKREYVCHRQIPKANSQVCAISSALTDGEPSRRSRLAAFRQLWTSRSICCRTHFQNAAIELLTHHKKKKKTL